VARDLVSIAEWAVRKPADEQPSRASEEQAVRTGTSEAGQLRRTRKMFAAPVVRRALFDSVARARRPARPQARPLTRSRQVRRAPRRAGTRRPRAPSRKPSEEPEPPLAALPAGGALC
jgi:hypothetical protein